jgi:hypothetical protein
MAQKEDKILNPEVSAGSETQQEKESIQYPSPRRLVFIVIIVCCAGFLCGLVGIREDLENQFLNVDFP